MSTSNYKTTNILGTDIIYNYFDLSGAISIASYYSDQQSTDNTKLKSASSLNSNLKHVNPIGYKINNSDIYNLYVPKCYVYISPVYTLTIPVPTITNRIMFFLQAPGGWGANGSTSPDNPGGDGGSGALYFGYIDRSVNAATSITLVLQPSLFGTYNVANTFTFTGGTSLILTCYSGDPSPGTNVGGEGGVLPTSNVTTGLTTINSYAGITGSGNARTGTVSPYTQYPNVTNSYSTNGPTVYFPLVTGNYGYGGQGGSSNGSSGLPGNEGIAAVWFLL